MSRLARYLAKPLGQSSTLTHADRRGLAAVLRRGDVLLSAGNTRCAEQVKRLTQSTWSSMYVGPLAAAMGAKGRRSPRTVQSVQRSATSRMKRSSGPRGSGTAGAVVAMGDKGGRPMAGSSNVAPVLVRGLKCVDAGQPKLPSVLAKRTSFTLSTPTRRFRQLPNSDQTATFR